MAAARLAMARDARLVFLPAFLPLIRTAIQRPSDGGEPLAPQLSAPETLALSNLQLLDCDSAFPNEVQHVLFRLVIGIPWPQSAAQPGHHLASGIGALFDAVIASKHDLRELSFRWMNWAERTLCILARERRRAIAEEASSPSPPPLPPWTGFAPPLAPLPATAKPLTHLEPKIHGDHAFDIFAPPMDIDTIIPRSWFDACNTQALRSILFVLFATPSWIARVQIAGSEKGRQDKKPWHIRVLMRLQLRYGDIAASVAAMSPTAPLLVEPNPAPGKARAPKGRKATRAKKARTDAPPETSTSLLLRAMAAFGHPPPVLD